MMDSMEKIEWIENHIEALLILPSLNSVRSSCLMRLKQCCVLELLNTWRYGSSVSLVISIFLLTFIWCFSENPTIWENIFERSFFIVRFYSLMWKGGGGRGELNWIQCWQHHRNACWLDLLHTYQCCVVYVVILIQKPLDLWIAFDVANECIRPPSMTPVRQLLGELLIFRSKCLLRFKLGRIIPIGLL